MDEETGTESALDAVQRLQRVVEIRLGPIFISKMKLKELADLYATYKREYGQGFASEEIQRRIESELR
jgi:hypothetical protein